MERTEDAMEECGQLNSFFTIICLKLGCLQDFMDDPR